MAGEGDLGQVTLGIEAQLDAASFAAAQTAATQQGRVIGAALAKAIQAEVAGVKIQPITGQAGQVGAAGNAGVSGLAQQQQQLANSGQQLAASQQAVAAALGPVAAAASRASLSFTPLAQAVANAGANLPGFANAATSAARGMAPLADQSGRVASILPGVGTGATSAAQSVGPLAAALRQATAQMAATGAGAATAAGRLQALQSALRGAQGGGPIGIQVPTAPLTAFQQAAQNASVASAKFGQSVQQAGASASSSAGGINAMGTAFAFLQAGVAGFLALQVVQGIRQTGQASQASRIQIEALAGAYGELEVSQQAVSRIAAELNISTLEARQGFSGLYAALRGTGVGVDQLEVLFVGLNKAARLSGAGAAEASGALLQLKQALSSGKLAGDELRSVLEAMPILSQALAKELGVSVGELKNLGAQGKITAETVFNAAKSIAGEVAPAQTSVANLSAAFTNLKERVAEAFGPALIGVVAQVAATVTVVGRKIAEAREPITNFAKGFVEVARAVVPVVLGIKAVTAVMNGLRLAQLAVAKAQALVLALSGPKGWAVLTLAVGATVGAFAGIDFASKGAASGMKEVEAEIKKLQAEFQKKLSETFWEGATEQAGELGKQAEQTRQKVADLNSEIAKINSDRGNEQSKASAINAVYSDRTKSLTAQESIASSITAQFDEQQRLLQAQVAVEERLSKEREYLSAAAGSKAGINKVKALELRLDTTQAVAELEKIESEVGQTLSQNIATANAELRGQVLTVDASPIDSASRNLASVLETNTARLVEVYGAGSQQFAAAGQTVFDALKEGLGQAGTDIVTAYNTAASAVKDAADKFAAAADRLQGARSTLERQGLLSAKAQQEGVERALGQIKDVRQNPDLNQDAVDAAIGKALASDTPLSGISELANTLKTAKEAQLGFDAAAESYREVTKGAIEAQNNLTAAINELLPQINISVTAPSSVAVDSNVPVRYS